ncbi:hypothetical protein [Ruminococcus sp.]|uniref:hypothetical protein n=1 Tax=Ruminococcus sp. TaxID=41978 RepID=UPI001B676B1B|nr:hypothetical protein [Ruminococcus sp.]MBP5433404.1 hypothetical protein [Ruminococcus sp.]
MSTKQIQYKLLREFGEDLLREIQISDDPNEWDYAHYIMGYALGLIQALRLDKSEASNINTEAKELTVRTAEECKRVQYVHKYNRALEYCKDRLKKCDSVNKVLHSATSDEIIRLYETGWSSHDTCDFYDEYEELEKKYLK